MKGHAVDITVNKVQSGAITSIQYEEVKISIHTILEVKSTELAEDVKNKIHRSIVFTLRGPIFCKESAIDVQGKISKAIKNGQT